MNRNFNLKELVRSDLADLVPYDVYPASPGMIKLDANENPFDLPLSVWEEIWCQLKNCSFNRYPDPLAKNLVQALADYTGVPGEGIVAGNGSDDLILTLLLTFGSGGHVIIATPTFSMYRVYSQIAGAIPVEIPRRPGFAVDVPAVIEKAEQIDARIIFLCSPNNPTGNAIPLEDITTILENCSSLVVVDEAYIEFGGESCIPLLASYSNLVILHTLSKAFGLAGLRIGYLLANPVVVLELLRVKQPFNLNIFSQLVACTVLTRHKEFQEIIAKILNLRDRLAAELDSLPGVSVFPTEANFILFRTPLPAEKVYQHLLKEGVLIRNVHGPGLEECLRVTVGEEEENRIFLEKLQLLF